MIIRSEENKNKFFGKKNWVLKSLVTIFNQSFSCYHSNALAKEGPHDVSTATLSSCL